MKNITRDYWVTDQCFDEIKRHVGVVMRGAAACETPYMHKIQISWEEPERKIEISESDVKNAIRSVFGCGITDDGIDLINKKLFGKTE